MNLIYINASILLAFLTLGIWYLYKLNKNFSMGLFYRLGFWAFMIMGVANFFKLYISWSFLDMFSIAVSCGGIFVNLLFATLFGWFAKQEVNKQGVEMEGLNKEDMEKLFQDG